MGSPWWWGLRGPWVDDALTRTLSAPPPLVYWVGVLGCLLCVPTAPFTLAPLPSFWWLAGQEAIFPSGYWGQQVVTSPPWSSLLTTEHRADTQLVPYTRGPEVLFALYPKLFAKGAETNSKKFMENGIYCKERQGTSQEWERRICFPLCLHISPSLPPSSWAPFHTLLPTQVSFMPPSCSSWLRPWWQSHDFVLNPFPLFLPLCLILQVSLTLPLAQNMLALHPWKPKGIGGGWLGRSRHGDRSPGLNTPGLTHPFIKSSVWGRSDQEEGFRKEPYLIVPW